MTKDFWVSIIFINFISTTKKFKTGFIAITPFLLSHTLIDSFISIKNRPVLVLKCDQGFVGYKSATSTRLECNKATYETIVVERTDKGMVHLKGKYPSFIYSWPIIRHILEHEFNCLGHLGSQADFFFSFAKVSIE